MTLSDLFHATTAAGHATALYRLPGATRAEAVVSLAADVLAGPLPRLESGPAGFAFHPFQESDRAPALWLPADVYHDGVTLHGVLPHPPGVLPQPPPKEGAFNINAFGSPSPSDRGPGGEGFRRAAPYPTRFADAAFYQELVGKGIGLIQAGAVQKVVPSRAARRALPADFAAFAAFEKLCAAYPRAFVSLVVVPRHEIVWLGASPELLAEVEGGHTFRTVALAGTQPAQDGHPPDEARWSHKEMEEQANVTRYIIECFKKLRLREYVETGPRTVQAGQLLHLRTDFAVDLTRVPFPALGSDMLRLLHPTSAVCGMPREAALAWLARHEGYDRAYYAGFLGPVNLPAEGTSRLFVNLRCMQVLPDRAEAILYAGGGLTAESNPAKEWAETEWKLKVVGSVVL